MDKKIIFNRSIRDILFAGSPLILLIIIMIYVIIKYVEPAPPNHFTIAAGADQAELQEFIKQYKDLLKQDGVTLNVRNSEGPIENLKLLEDDAAGVSAAFVEDGLGSPSKQPDVVSLGSLSYEPLWVFYRDQSTLNHLSQLEGKKIAVGKLGHGAHIVAERLLKLSGVDMTDTKLVNIDSNESAKALETNKVDAAILMMPADSPLVHELVMNKNIKLMNILQAEGISRTDASFHHLVLPRGSLDLKNDIPREDTHILSPTLTLLVRDDLHPALAYLLLKTAAQVHNDPGLLEKKGEFPSNKDDQFPLSDDAVQFYKSGGPFWQRYLPYWLAAWLDRFVLIVIPFLALVLPLIKTIPKIYQWRIRSQIYQRYGELKFLETQVKPQMSAADYQKFYEQLDNIEERVNKMKVPKNFTEYIYSVRGHIQFVRDHIAKDAGEKA